MEQSPSTTKTLPGIGELFSMSKEAIMKRKEFFLILAALPAIIQFAGVLLLEISVALFPLMIIVLIFAAVIGVLATIAMVQALANEQMNDWKKALTESKKFFWPYIWTGILVGIVVLIGFLLLIIPGIYLSILFSFYMYTLILDNKRGWDAAESSKHLVKGHWWAILGRMIGFSCLL